MNKINIFKTSLLVFAVGAILSCTDSFLDREPLSVLTPEVFYTEESQLASFGNYYLRSLPSQSYFTDINVCRPLSRDLYYFYVSDIYTDNQANFQTTQRYFTEHSDHMTGDDQLDNFFSRLYAMNWFLQTTLPRLKEGTLSGNQTNCSYYIGEIYMLRAWITWYAQISYGDLPIITRTLPDDKEVLIEASKRQPRNEVARWMLADLDSAIMYMPDNGSTPAGKQLPGKYVALHIKSRIALFEATWLKYFKNTPFVPNGPGWPGAATHPNYQFPAGSIDNEINWFLDQAMAAAEQVADNYPLMENTGLLPQDAADPKNPYFDMLCNATDYTNYSEVLAYREYSQALGLTHNGVQSANLANDQAGMTRALVESFVMKNGLPIYAANSGYKGDDYIEDVPVDRDDRLRLWLKLPNQVNVLFNLSAMATGQVNEPPFPLLTLGDWMRYNTGYTSRKGASQDGAQMSPKSHVAWLPSPMFRSAEAMLNYIEAYYEKNGAIGGKADQYWRALRRRANVDEDYNKTIAATDMQKEAATGNWACYSGGKLVDPTLFNIRRERNSEMWGEDCRKFDIRRWRAMDQLINYKDKNGFGYQPEGIKLWTADGKPGKNHEAYYAARALELQLTGANANYAELTYGETGSVSSPDKSQYLRPFQLSTGFNMYQGMMWKMAWYLYPIGLGRMLDASPVDGDITQSSIYQNPGWSLESSRPAEDLNW